MTFATYLAANSQCECQIRNSTRNIYLLVVLLILTFAKCPLRRDANVRIGPLVLEYLLYALREGRCRIQQILLVIMTGFFAAQDPTLRPPIGDTSDLVLEPLVSEDSVAVLPEAGDPHRKAPRSAFALSGIFTYTDVSCLYQRIPAMRSSVMEPRTRRSYHCRKSRPHRRNHRRRNAGMRMWPSSRKLFAW